MALPQAGAKALGEQDCQSKNECTWNVDLPARRPEFQAHGDSEWETDGERRK